MGTVAIGLVVIIFIYEGIKYDYYVGYLFISICASFIGILMENFLYISETKGTVENCNFFFALHITAFAIYLFYMFMFLNSLERVRPSITQLFIVTGLFATMIIGVWQHFFFHADMSYDNTTVMVTTARLAYDLFGIYVFLLNGVNIYYRIYRITKEKLAFLFVLTQIFMGVGFLYRVFREFWAILAKLPKLSISLDFFEKTQLIRLACDILALLAIIVFLCLYLYNLKYIVRLPHDIYFLGIYTLSGMKIYRASFKNSKDKRVDDKILSGIFSAFHSIFKSLFQSNHPIESIRSEDFSLIFETNSNIMVVVATEHPTYVLLTALKQILRQFEAEFPKVYINNYLDLSRIKDVRKIISRRFPFVQIINDGYSMKK